MKSKLFLLAGLCAGFALVATAVPADEPAVSADAFTTLSEGFPSPVQICHYPPGKNSKGSARSRTGKVIVVQEDVCDYSYLCEETDTDDDLSQTDLQVIGDAALAEAEVGTPGCELCPEAWQAFEAEVQGHLDNHEGDCWSSITTDCGEVEPNEFNGQCQGIGADDDDDDDR